MGVSEQSGLGLARGPMQEGLHIHQRLFEGKRARKARNRQDWAKIGLIMI